MSKEFGSRLKVARLTLQLLQSTVADDIGVSLPTVRLLEEGAGKVSGLVAYARRVGMELRGGPRLPPAGSLHEGLRLLRESKGIRKPELAEKADISATSLASLERGDDVRVATLLAVSKVLGAGIDLAFPSVKGPPPAFFSADGAGQSSKDQTWTTPKAVVDSVIRVLGEVDVDPCSPRLDGPVPAAIHYTEKEDGLAQPWTGRVFVNPPYNRALPKWLGKAAEEHASSRATAVLALVPARTDTAWCHAAVESGADFWLLRKRLRFRDDQGPAPFGSVFFGWGMTEDMRDTMAAEFVGALHHRSSHGKNY